MYPRASTRRHLPVPLDARAATPVPQMAVASMLRPIVPRCAVTSIGRDRDGPDRYALQQQPREFGGRGGALDEPRVANTQDIRWTCLSDKFHDAVDQGANTATIGEIATLRVITE